MKLKTLLTLAIASIGSLQGAWARTAPTFPKTQTLESGKTYYLYNVGSDRFLTYNPSSVGYAWARTDAGKEVRLAAFYGAQYYVQFVDNNRYFCSYSGYTNTNSTNNPSGEQYRMTFTETEGGYTIQRVYDANGDEYVGFDGSDGNSIKSNLRGENIVWQLLDPTETARFIAKRNLYRALEANTDFNIDEYEAVYENESSTNSQLQAAADKLNNAYLITNKYKKPEWSDYPILFSNQNGTWDCYNNSNYFDTLMNGNSFSSITATVFTDDDATLVFSFWNDVANITVTLDGVVVFEDLGWQWTHKKSTRHFIEMNAGKHIIEWTFQNTSSSTNYACLENVGIEQTPTLIANLKEPGSLGTEVLKCVDHINNVRKLTVTGEMNSDDWERILMMTSLFSLDLSGATITEIPEYQLSRNRHGNELSFLHSVKLPNTLASIGDYAFSGTYLDNRIEFPTSLKRIGNYAFQSTHIKSAILPDNMEYIGEGAFANIVELEDVSYPTSLNNIPYACFRESYKIRPFTLHEGLRSIEAFAFYGDRRINPRFPKSLTSIGYVAFQCCNLDSLFINENVSISQGAFTDCNNMVYAEFPTTFHSISVSNIVSNSDNLETVVFKSPTMVDGNYKESFFFGCVNKNITIKVPNYLVNTYKQDSYWYNYNIVGFNTADIKDWYINQPLTLGADARIAGQPNIHMERSGSIKISGDAPMTIDDLWTCKDWNAGAGWNTMLLSTCDNVSVSGKYTHRVYTPSKRWVFICLPFDTKVDDITSNSSFAIRYYDGANRAENGSGGNWKNYSKDDIIPAGTGFILQTSRECSTWFTAQDNASKQYVFQNKEFVKALEANVSESNANKGWNLVGNPWLSYYNIHKLNFTAPITVWNVNNRNYTAYSIIDDDYAIKPSEAFFVQCPDEVNSISFPIDGRQLTSVIESQNAARPYGQVVNERKLIDVELSDGELTDKTRFVVNPEAEMSYELNRDASKFFSMDAAVPQIYTIENGELLAINERPIGEGTVQVGFRVAVDGEYTITSPRNGFTNITLVDNETGIETDLSLEEGYTFSASAGTNDSRFLLRVGGTVVTEIVDMKQNDVKANCYFNLNGQNVTTPKKGIYVVNGKKFVIK